jgi:type 1 glutamine amidotransferase
VPKVVKILILALNHNIMTTRRSFIVKAGTAMAAAFIASPVVSGRKLPEEKALRGKKVLFVWGGWMGHEPDKCRDIFVPWMKAEGADVIVSDSLDAYLKYDLKKDIDLVVQAWTMGQIEGNQENALLEAVRGGVGLAGWHGGLGDSFRNNTEYQFMVGGQWVAHPGGVIDYRVNIIDHDDPLTKGLSDFEMHSEQYYVHVDPNVKVLATTTFNGQHADWIDGNIVPVVWKKYYGRGRVFYSSLGHVADDFKVPQALEIQKRGIIWASQSKYETREELLQPVYKNPIR